MKNVFLLLGIMATLTFATSCTKENAENKTKVEDTPKTQVPDDYVGKWICGDFNMSTFWSFNVNTQNNGGAAVAYNIKKDGSAEQFIYYPYTDGSNKKTLTYRKGTVTFDAVTKTIKFCPAEGTFRIFQNGKKTESSIKGEGLYPAYAPKYRNCFFDVDNQVHYLVGTDDLNVQLGFARVEW